MVLEIVQREIAQRGIGYLVLRDCPEERLGETLGRGMERLKKAGAKRVWATSLPEGEPLHAGPIGVWRLTPVHDILLFERATTDVPKPELKLATKPLKKTADDHTWAEMVDRAYLEVPGARKTDPANIHRTNHRCGFAWTGEKIVGAYEVDLSEKIPEITILAIPPSLRRQGYGRALVRTLLGGMKKMGRCTTSISSCNAPALALAVQAGFRQVGVRESWFEVT